MIERKVFFDRVRRHPFGGRLSQGQVDGCALLIEEWERRGSVVPDAATGLRWLAYILATAFHETARTMQPVAEYGRGRGRRYGRTDPVTGHAYYGRGYVQLTWKTNYHKAGRKLGIDLVTEPDRALEPAIAARVLIEGMIEGWFAGDREGRFTLHRFLAAKADDPVGARRIVNGTDRAELIAGYHDAFLAALQAATAAAPAREREGGAAGAATRFRKLVEALAKVLAALFRRSP